MKVKIGFFLLVIVLIGSYFVVFDPFVAEVEEGFSEIEKRSMLDSLADM